MSIPPPRICQQTFTYADGSTWQCGLPFDGSFHEGGHEYKHQLTKPVDDERMIAKDQRPVQPQEVVDHPEHYGGPNNPHEVIKCLEAWDLTINAYRFNAIKYLARADKKGDTIEDLRKAMWYIEREIKALETPQ